MALTSTASRRTAILTPLVPTACQRVSTAPNYGAIVLADTPFGYWRLDETAGTNAADSSGNAHDGTYVAPVTLGQTPLITTGHSVLFTNGRVTLPANLIAIAAAASAFSMEAWVTTTTAANRSFLSGRNSGDGNPIIDFGVNLGKLFVQVRDSAGGGLMTLTTGASVNDGLPHHFVATRTTAKAWVIYIDSFSSATGSDTMGTGVTNCDDSYIAQEGQAVTAFPGTVDEVALYASTLSAARVLAHFNAGKGI
jgi:hypothetical protein